MTEKRFMLDDCGELIDLNNHKFVDYGEECCNLLNELHEESQDLKSFNKDLAENLSACANARISKDDLIEKLTEENEQLKSSDTITDLETEIMNLKTTIQQLRTDNTKQKKKLNTAMKENEHIKQTIKDMINTERTELGKMTLRQLWRQIQ